MDQWLPGPEKWSGGGCGLWGTQGGLEGDGTVLYLDHTGGCTAVYICQNSSYTPEIDLTPIKLRMYVIVRTKRIVCKSYTFLRCTDRKRKISSKCGKYWHLLNVYGVCIVHCTTFFCFPVFETFRNERCITFVNTGMTIRRSGLLDLPVPLIYFVN